MAKRADKSRRVGAYVIKAAESRSSRVASKKDGPTRSSKKSDGQLARAVLKNWKSKPASASH